MRQKAYICHIQSNSNMANKYANEKFLTTNDDLESILSHCDTCFRVTHEAKYILYSHNLPDVKLNKPQSKLAIIVNEQDSNNPLVGHWVVILLEKKSNQCLVVNPLANSKEDTISHINQFCHINNMSPVYFSAPFQNPSSKTCGYLCLYILYCFAHSNINAIWKMRGSILSTPIRLIEPRMMHRVAKHFKINI